MTNPLSTAEAHAAGFACVLPMLFDLSSFLTQVAAVFQQPLTLEQEGQAEIVCRFLEALSAENWARVGALCTQEVRYYPTRDARVGSARQVCGRAALRAYGQEAAVRYRQLVFTDLRLYARPSGLAACYTGHWTTSEGQRYRLATTTVFRFTGDQICLVGSTPRWRCASWRMSRPRLDESN